jgi:hypothetical protein
MKKKKLWCVLIIDPDDRDNDKIVHVRCNAESTAKRKAVASLGIGCSVNDLIEEPLANEVTEEDIIK